VGKRGAIFLDRDGTLIKDVHHLRRIEDIELIPGASEAIARINRAGIPAIIITNQSAVARGWLTEEQVQELQEEVDRQFQARNAHFNGFYFCPHHPEIGNSVYKIRCECRKPKPGLILKAAREKDLDLNRSVMIGNSESDVLAGRAAGCQTVLFTSTQQGTEGATTADYIASEIGQAISWAMEISGE
jgi:D-glycero-D-manno-heptose 1,7-bisphosphate phosphatase